MTGTLPDRERSEPLETLRNVRRINPNEQATQRAMQRALAAIQGAEFEKPRHSSWRKIIMRSGIAAAILLVIVATGWLALDGPAAVAAPTWSDMTRQAIGIDRVYIDGWSYKGRELAEHSEIWIQSPGVIRMRSHELIDGKMVPTKNSIATPDAAVRWDERTKLGEHASTSNPYMAQSRSARHYEAILGLSLFAGQPEANLTINGEQVAFEPVEQTHPEDPTLRGFKLKNKNPAGPELFPLFQTLVYWFAERSNNLQRLTMVMGDGDQAQRVEMVVDFDPDVPAGWFDVALPEGCFDVAAGVLPRLSPEVREVYEKVTAARKRFGDYRAVIWRDRTGGWPSFREATRGDQWRCDIIDWTVMHSAITTGDNPQGYVKISPTDPFGKLWEQVNRDDYELDMSAMTWQGKFAILHYKLGGRGSRVSAQLYGAIQSGYEKFFAPSLRFLAWPEWMWWENLQDHGWDLRQTPFQWRLGPADPQNPDRVEVIGERKKGFWTLVKYIFDRSKDWLCVRQEWGYTTGDKKVWDIKTFGRTDEGLWYPLRATTPGSSGYGYDYAIERGTAEPGFFDYPEGIPQPTDPFAEFMSQVKQKQTTTAPKPPSRPDGN